ncbi:sce7726 family protein [Pseudoalteromonas peptidolytica]|uniref:sce7726 family protein n=1 Tax=Pseudoalteromonas peptidolytica TaxID=61150 RepID=UPI00298D731D|nr:sce7726 family protein [Pseudoalteromonas peptidolytica]MDW7549209.1 sce7726 family protein [Pseudoalteromonas peptidolytica]
MFKESNFKAAAIDWLIAKGELDKGAVLINELPVDGFSRRADLVVANGKLQAFEIKSDADSLIRLEGQIETYLRFFDKVTLICSRKFTEKAKKTLPKQVEIVEVNFASPQSPKLIIKRRGKAELVTSSRHFLSFVDKRHLVQALRKRGIASSTADTHQELYEKYRNLPVTFCRSVVLDYLKSKYKATHDNFVAFRNENTAVGDLELLSPNKQADIEETASQEDDEDLEQWGAIDDTKLMRAGALDITQSMKKVGMVVDKPVLVIPRACKVSGA